MVNLNHRRRQPELMDQPGLDPGQHVQALQGLERINRFSGSVRILWPAIRALLRQAGRPVRILDIASGAGDVPIGLWHKVSRAGLPLHIDGWDISPFAVAYACRRAAAAKADVQFVQADALSTPLGREYDAVISSLFLHHLGEDEAVALLRRMAEGARQLVLVNDLLRCRRGYWLACLGTRLLSGSPIVHVDGPLSVEAAFTRSEALALAKKAELVGATVTRRWPARFLVSWERP
jgi:2-polyprenyl-3-methyl-5-hydroxy-6-metoxy-1,4-benzoquinol methylase